MHDELGIGAEIMRSTSRVYDTAVQEARDESATLAILTHALGMAIARAQGVDADLRRRDQALYLAFDMLRECVPIYWIKLCRSARHG